MIQHLRKHNGNGDDKNQVLNILNLKNKSITREDVEHYLSKVGLSYSVSNLEIFQRAFTHKSYVTIDNDEIVYKQVEGALPLQPKSNERLELLGDSVLGAVVISYIYHRYPTKAEGFLTKLKNKLVRTNILAKHSRYLQLQDHLLISAHIEEMCDGRDNDRILEDLFEAFVGALFKDVYQDRIDRYGQAMQVCNDFIVALMEKTVDFRQMITVNDNYKEQLLQYFQKNFGGSHPIYHTIHVEGPTNNRLYTMGVYHPDDPNLLIGKGTSKKKVQAEQMASKEALAYLEQV